MSTEHPEQEQLSSERDALRRVRLSIMQWTATGLLVGMVLLYALAVSKGGPAWGYVAAFAEAAMVGALADWFAVVALFRHPMGIPLWHTAIIPDSKDDIARNLGEFVETHFVSVEAVVARIRDFDPARKLAQWLIRPENGERLGRILAQAASLVLASLDHEKIGESLRRSVIARLSRYDLAEPVAEFGTHLVAEKQHHVLLDWALTESSGWLDTEAAQARIKGMVDEALGVENRYMKLMTGLAVTRLREGFKTTLQAAMAEPEHPLGQRYEAYIQQWLVRIRTDAEVQERLRRFQDDTLAHPRLQGYLEGLWGELRGGLEADLGRQDPQFGRHMAGLARQLGGKLASDETLQCWLNATLVAAATPLVVAHRGEVAAFIQTQIAAWSKEEMSERIELAVGRDLQFIRINGTLVGGLVGVLIHGATLWLR